MGSPKSSGRAELPGRPHRKGSTLWSAIRRRNRSGSGRQRHRGRGGGAWPRELANADQVWGAADRKKAEAQAARADLRKEAPGEVCQRFDAALGSAADELERQRSQLQLLRSAPRMK